MLQTTSSFFKDNKKLHIEELESDAPVTKTQSDHIFRPGYLTDFKKLTKKAFTELQTQSTSSPGSNLTADGKLSIVLTSLEDLLETVSPFLGAAYFSNDRRIFLKMATYWYAQLLNFCNVGKSQTIRSLTDLEDKESLCKLADMLANNIFSLLQYGARLYCSSSFENDYWQTPKTVECKNIKLHLELARQLSPTPEATVEYIINDELPVKNNHSLLCWLQTNDEEKNTTQTNTQATVDGDAHGASPTPW